jgi:hypothetical protein
VSQTSTNSPGWNLSPSYDVGVKYTFRNLLKDNPYRQNYFRHWLATFDHENVKKYYNYETGEKRKKGELAATEIHYDQVQTMVYNANLPKEIEDELFYHLDYHLNRETKSIDFLKLKEFFAFCGIPGAYDLEGKRHFLMAKESPFLLNDLHISKWTAEQKDKNRPILARMMAAPGEIPYNRDKIDTLKEQYNLEWLNAFSKTELHDKFMGRANQIFASKRTEEEIRQAAEEAERNGIDLDEYDEEIESFTKIFDKTPEAQAFLSEIKSLETDEQIKLDRALAQYVPDALLANDQLFKSYDQDLGRYGKAWDLAMHDKMGNADYWAVQYLGHEGPETCSSEPPSEEEAAELDPELLELGEYQVARYEKMMKHFDHEVWPVLRSRYCAIEDWILRDYTMNAINKGELAKARREDIPRLFQEALRGELNDGLLKSLKFPIRIEPAEDGKNHVLWMNDLPVEVFNPAEILPELGGGNLVDHVPPPPGSSFASTPAHDFSRDIDIDQELIDFKIHSPGYINDAAPEVLPASSSLMDGVDMPMTSPMTAQDPIPFERPAYQQPMSRQKYAGRDRPLINGQHKRPRHEKKIYDMSNPAKSPMERDLMRQKKNMMGNHIQELTRPPVNPRGVPNINISLPNFSFKRAADEVKEASSNLQKNATKGDVSNELNTLKQAAEGATENAQQVLESKEPRKYKKHIANLYRETRQALSDLSSRGLDHVRESTAFKLCEKALKALADILRDIVKMILSIGKGNQQSPSSP